MCANWIVSVGKVGAAIAAGSSKASAAPSRFDIASEYGYRGPQWRFVAGGADAATPGRDPAAQRLARHVLQDVLAELTSHD